MAATPTTLACAQCGRDAPAEPQELTGWAYGPLAVQGDFADTIEHLLLCPDCVQEEHDHQFDPGGAG